MESQQMMELLLAMNKKMATKEDRKIDREEMIARMDANTKAMLAMNERWPPKRT
jgi:hypothetical protein